ncbi:MAG: hypothetical protein AB7Q81_12840 [Gammaproteobacteria bacterium]
MRDDFSKSTKELLAKRVGFRCSNPKCRRPTAGPQDDPGGAVSIGVAAHITAAAPGGPRYDLSMSQEQRSDSSNGLWLCQTCAKLIDSDETKFSLAILEGWKRSAERFAAAALAQPVESEIGDQSAFAKAEHLMPGLLREMQEDLQTHPTTREAVILSRKWSYNGSQRQIFAYYYEDHDKLEGKFDVLENLGLVSEITFNNVRRYRIEEALVDYLTGI